MVDKHRYKLRRRASSLKHTVTFLITVGSLEVVIPSAIIRSKYGRHESSIRDVEIACAICVRNVRWKYQRRYTCLNLSWDSTRSIDSSRPLFDFTREDLSEEGNRMTKIRPISKEISSNCLENGKNTRGEPSKTFDL